MGEQTTITGGDPNCVHRWGNTGVGDAINRWCACGAKESTPIGRPPFADITHGYNNTRIGQISEPSGPDIEHRKLARLQRIEAAAREAVYWKPTEVGVTNCRMVPSALVDALRAALEK